jgi:TRAP-type mannitol/chloroaromatic compound transport system substrate-binding protein
LDLGIASCSEIKSRDDVRGLKLRSPGLGGEVYRRLGALPQTKTPGEILVALQSGVIDGAEFVGPGSDIALGLYRFAPFYYGPGFNKPNGTGECIMPLKAWTSLNDEAKAIMAHACAAEASDALGELAGKCAGRARFLHGRPRQNLRLVAHLIADGAGGAGRVREPST